MAVPAPQKILEILYGPPPPPATNNWGTWASSNDKTFPEGAMYEWAQASTPLEEYDQFSIVGTSGWIIEQPDESQSDFPFDHPFGASVLFELYKYSLFSQSFLGLYWLSR
jgi:hypothetical protein